MKKLLLVLFILTIKLSVFADDIYLNNGKKFTGKVLLVSKNKIEFVQEGKIKSKFYKTSNVQKVVYDNGKVQNFTRNQTAVVTSKTSTKNTTDAILLKNEKILYGKILRVTNKNIEYDPQGNIPFDIVARKNVQKIIYRNGKEVNISGTSSRVSKEKSSRSNDLDSEPDNDFDSTDRFYNALFRIAIIGGVGFHFGNNVDEEEELYNQNGLYDNSAVDHEEYYGGLEIDLMINGISTDFSFGLKTRYLSVSGVQIYPYESEADDQTNESDKKLYHYDNIQVGPVLNFILFPDKINWHFVIQLYCLGGKIFNGDYHAIPMLRDEGYAVNKSEYYQEFTGYNYSLGLGFHYVVNTSFPVTIGFNYNYTQSWLKFDNELPLYNKDKITLKSSGFEIAAGVHF